MPLYKHCTLLLTYTKFCDLYFSASILCQLHITILIIYACYRESSNTPPGLSTNDILHSFQSLKLKPALKKAISPESIEMSVYKSSRKSRRFNDRISQNASASDPPYGQHRKSQSLLNFISLEKDGINIDVTESNTSIRRRP
ncbi:hypothetical protein KSP40_PGU017723 [Platanthera guangdongensis]|uniref:Uncharacterized protein n=1 Tax=Platanthera guangdongensis TaxID=2320717 RepID=A0ABR2LSM4_9ASPA